MKNKIKLIRCISVVTCMCLPQTNVYAQSINQEDIDLILDWRVLGYGKDEPWEKRSNTNQDAFNK